MIFVAGIAIAVLFEFLLLSKKDKSLSDKVLAVWMFIIVVHLFLFYLHYAQELFQYPFLLGIDFPFPLLHGVFLFLYVATVTDQLPRRRSIVSLHFVPALAIYAYLVPFFLLPGEEKVTIFQNRGAGYETFLAFRSAAIYASGVAYVGLSEFFLRRHRRRILDEFSYKDRIDLQWLRLLTWGMGAIWILVFLQHEVILFGGVAVFVFLIGFFGIRQVRIFGPDHRHHPETEPRPKYVKSGMTPALSEALYTELIRMMKEQAPYKKSDLSLDELAARLNAHPNHLSQIINEREQRNFYDFVNSYRLEEFKRLASDPRNRHLTLISLAFDCGFNSKSSFNRHFKKVTGQTPTDFFADAIRK